MKIIIIIIAMLILFLIPFIPAQGLVVNFAEIDVHKKGNSFQISTHVFNISTGERLDNTTTSCLLDLYSQNGTHLINQLLMDFDDDGKDWELFIDGNNITTTGEYDYLVICNTTELGGFVEVGFVVTGSGEIVSTPKAILYIFFITLLFISFLVTLAGISRVPTSNHTDEFGNIMSINNLKYLVPVLFALAWGLLLAIIFISSNVALNYIDDEMIGNLLFNIFSMMMWLTIPMLLFWVIFILFKVYSDKETQRSIKRGVEIKPLPV